MNTMHKIRRWLLLPAAVLLALSTGCGSPDVQYPKTPAPPPRAEPGSTTVEQPAQPAK
ncbi:MAG: hypothetical protein ACOX1P_12700 [Thermoguttaceae bacterium]|jgi:hypothetical protein